MRNVSGQLHSIYPLASTLLAFIVEARRFLVLCLRPAPAFAAELLFLRTQLALYEERQVKPRRATNLTRFVMVKISSWFDWRSALRIVTPETFTRWHRHGLPAKQQIRVRPILDALHYNYRLEKKAA